MEVSTTKRDVPIRRSLNTQKIAYMAVFTALETAVTYLLQIQIPATNGYFNIGESIIIFTAILFGPWIGGFVGGIGACLADLIAGYTQYAPITFIAKSIEGILIGFLFQVLKNKSFFEKHWKLFIYILGLTLGCILTIIGFIYFLGNFLFIFIGMFFTLLFYYIGLKLKKDTSLKLLAIIPGGLWMIFTYFVSEIIWLGYEVGTALIEVPVNILQVLLSTMIAIPLISGIEQYIPQDIQSTS